MNEETEPESSDQAPEVTAPGEWERKPSEPEERRHDDDAEPPVPPSDDADDDQAEQEEDGSIPDEHPDGADSADEDTGGPLERHAEPLMQGSELNTPGGPVPTRSLVAMGVFIAVFCAAFLGLWALLGTFGIFLGIVAGIALGLGALKLLADRERAA
jgi:hypothetical protein